MSRICKWCKTGDTEKTKYDIWIGDFHSVCAGKFLSYLFDRFIARDK